MSVLFRQANLNDSKKTLLASVIMVSMGKRKKAATINQKSLTAFPSTTLCMNCGSPLSKHVYLDADEPRMGEGQALAVCPTALFFPVKATSASKGRKSV